MRCYSSSAICLNQPADSQSHQQCEAKRSGKSVRSLPKSLRSLLGLKAHLTPSWLESVCRIVQDLPSTKSVDASKMETPMCEESINHSNTEVDASASKIRGDLALLNDCLIQLNMQRRQALNDLLDLKGNIRVFCRVRPFLQNEAHGHMRSAISSNSSNVFLKFANSKSKQYSFDKVFHPGSTQEEVFAEIDPVIKSALDGYNVCIFAYGQTGTGKTFTMEGRPGCPGIVPCGIEALFQQALESNYKYLFTFSMLEIYMGSIRDLLIPQRKKRRVHKAPGLSIRMDPNGGIEIENLVAIQVNDFEQVQSLYKLGKQLRSTASTNSNSKSSRSHCLIRITLTCPNAHERRRETNKIWMVDLGGSERLLKTQASGRRLEEGKAINLSLSALGDVISALQSKRSHVPYRNSKLTQVLRDSLESDSKTLMIVHISPNEEDLCETICSLGFATRARSIHLGDEESEEARSKKEVAMGELLQMVKHFESECRYVKQDIKRLNEQLKLVERTDLQSDGHTESSYPSTAGPQSHHGNHKVNVKDFSAVSANLPRFMRPTICSQRKTIIDHHPQTSMKKPPLPSKRKSSSVYAESVTSVAKDLLRQSDNGSDCSTFICSYMNWNYSADDGTDCSQSASEYEIKKVIFPEKENSPRSFGISPSIESIIKSDDCRVAKSNQKMRFTVDDWLHSQVKEWSTTYFQGNKRAIAIQVDGIANGLHEKDLGNTTIQEEMLTCDSTKISGTVDKKIERKDLNKYETVKQFGEVVLNEKSLKDTILDETRVLSVASLSNITDGKYAQSRIFDEMLMSKLIPEHHLEEFSEITKDGEPGYDLYAELMETPAQKDCKLSSSSYSEDFHQSKQYIEDADEPRLHLMKAQRSLYMVKGPPALDGKNVAPEENMAPATNILEEKHGQGTNGMFRQTVQMLWACVLLGFGVQSLGFGHDFYDGLLL